LIIELDGYFLHKYLLSNSDLEISELERVFGQITVRGERPEGIYEYLCKEYGMKEIEKINDRRIDIVIDLDTFKIYKPIYLT